VRAITAPGPELVEFSTRDRLANSPSGTQYFKRVRHAQGLLIQLLDK
jgi:hypothetical protein